MLGLFIGYNYQIINGNGKEAWCSPTYSLSYPTLSEATRKCNVDLTCTMILEEASHDMTNFKTTGKADYVTKFYLCNVGAVIKEKTCGSMCSILRIKTRE